MSVSYTNATPERPRDDESFFPGPLNVPLKTLPGNQAWDITGDYLGRFRGGEAVVQAVAGGAQRSRAYQRARKRSPGATRALKPVVNHASQIPEGRS